jgi:thiol-disulfide isomerase/thioredoxin
MKFLVFTFVLCATGLVFGQSYGGSMMKDSSSSSSDSSMMKSSGAMAVSQDERQMSADPMDITLFNLKGLGPQVIAYTSEKDAWSLAASQKVVYFFAATWCPDCQATYRDIKANYSTIPGNFTIVFVNYDKAKALKAKYGITVQHSFVLIGPDGQAQKSWAGTSAVADIVKTALSM